MMTNPTPTAAERAVLLLHDVFDFDHGEIAALVGKSTAACRKLLERAREHIAVINLAVNEAHIRYVFFHGDLERLRHV